MHEPAKHNMVKSRALDKVIQKKAYILHNHLFGFFGHLKWIHIPAPVPVKKHAVVQFVLYHLAGRCFTNAHRTANEIDMFHIEALYLLMSLSIVRYTIIFRCKQA